MSDFKFWESQGHAPARPYDSLMLHRMKDNAAHVRQHRGQNVAYQWQTNSSDPTSSDWRPFTSVSRWVSIMRIPWFVSPGLSELKCSLLCRVSNADLDLNGLAADYLDVPVSVRVWLETGGPAASDAPIEIAPFLGVSGAVWQFRQWTHKIESELLTAAGGLGGYSHLHLEIRSQCPLSAGDTVIDALDSWPLDGWANPDRVKVTTAGAFTTGEATGANEKCAFAVAQPHVKEGYILHSQPVDAQRVQEDVDGKALYVSDPGISWENKDSAYAFKLVASYIQPVSLAIEEIYQ
jgi:hypothetical protein